MLLIAPRWPSQSWFSNTSGITMRGASRTATVSRPPSHAGDQGVPSQFAVALSDCVADLWQSFVETGLPRAAAQLAADCRRKSTLGLYAVSYNLLKSCVHVPRRPRFPRLQTRSRPFPQGTIQRRKTSHYQSPPWNMTPVLETSARPPSELLRDASLWAVTFKTAFLLTAASLRRRSAPHALP